MTTKVRAGVVGAGPVGGLGRGTQGAVNNSHAGGYSRIEECDLVAVADVDAERLHQFGEQWGISPEHRYSTAAQMYAEASLDVVSVTTPPIHHHHPVIEAAEGGVKVILVEKPLAMSAEGVRRVLDAAAASGRHLAVGMHHRFRPDVGALTAFVAGGELGDIYAVRANALTQQMPAVRSTWRQKTEEAGGGALMDLGVRVLDLAFWLVDYPRIKRVTAVFRSGEGDVEEAATVFAVSESGIAFSVEVSWNLFAEADRHRARVMGTEGSGALPPLDIHKRLGGQPVDVTPRQPRTRGGENRFQNAYRRLLDHFVRAVLGETDDTAPVEQVHLMEVVAAAYRSAREGREIHLGED